MTVALRFNKTDLHYFEGRREEMSGVEVDVFVMPNDWRFFQATLAYEGGCVVIAGEPHGSVATPIVTLEMAARKMAEHKSAVLYLTADEALEIWTALGGAIKTASGKEPEPVKLISDDERSE